MATTSSTLSLLYSPIQKAETALVSRSKAAVARWERAWGYAPHQRHLSNPQILLPFLISRYACKTIARPQQKGHPKLNLCLLSPLPASRNRSLWRGDGEIGIIDWHQAFHTSGQGAGKGSKRERRLHEAVIHASSNATATWGFT